MYPSSLADRFRGREQTLTRCGPRARRAHARRRGGLGTARSGRRVGSARSGRSGSAGPRAERRRGPRPAARAPRRVVPNPVRYAPIPRTATNRGRSGASRRSSSTAPSRISSALELVGGRGRPGDEVRHAEVPPEQRRVLERGEEPVGEPGAVERLPEPVARPREVMPDRARPQPGVDPDEHDVEVRAEDVGDRPAARGLEFRLRGVHRVSQPRGRSGHHERDVVI